MQIHFLYGTQSGTAEFLCDHLASKLSNAHDVMVSSLDEVEPTSLDANSFYVLVSATFGSGELPESAQAFSKALEEHKPDLTGIRFTVFGLGDRSFGETFNNGSQILMMQMLACNAEMTGERGLHDASSTDLPQNIALPWLKEILKQLPA